MEKIRAYPIPSVWYRASLVIGINFDLGFLTDPHILCPSGERRSHFPHAVSTSSVDLCKHDRGY